MRKRSCARSRTRSVIPIIGAWWTPEDAKKFEGKADCTVKEYDNFIPVDDAHVNGKLTLGENTADNGGLRLAFLAFLADAKRRNTNLSEKQDGYTPVSAEFFRLAPKGMGEVIIQFKELAIPVHTHSFDFFRPAMISVASRQIGRRLVVAQNAQCTDDYGVICGSSTQLSKLRDEHRCLFPENGPMVQKAGNETSTRLL